MERSADGWKTYTTCSYDKRGNLILETYYKNKKAETAGAYTYDETNKMVRGVNGNAEESICTYNGLGALMEQSWIIAKNGYGYHDVSATAVVDGEVVVDSVTGKRQQKVRLTPEELEAANAAAEAAEAASAETGIIETSADANTLTATLVTYGNAANGNNGNSGNGNGTQDKPTGSDVKNTSTVVKQFVVDFSSETYKPLMEHEVNGLDYRYVYSDKARLSVVVQGIENGSASLLDDAGELHAYYHCDYLGTTDYLTSAVNSKVISWTSYSEWGEITHNAVLKCGARELDLVKEYATHDFDAVLNMYYAKARFYDADNRRFAAVDPILDPSQYDLREYAKHLMILAQYVYVLDNPLNNIDLLGNVYSPVQLLSNSRLSIGSTDKDAIKILQSALQYLGHNVKINGTYDAATLVAVNEFKDKVIPNGNKAGNRGVVGPTTWNLIMNEVIASKTGYGYFEMIHCNQMRLGSKSDDVKRLQMALRQLGYNIGSAGIDGEFGPATQSAVNQFKNLYIPYGNAGANAGVVGATTWEYLEDQLFRSLLGYPVYKDSVVLSVPEVPHVGDDIIDVALRELAAPDNTGLRYLAVFGIKNKQSWCAAFVTWCADQVGAIDSGAFPSNCPTVYSGGASMKEYSANPGSMIYWFDSRGLFVPRYNGNNAGYIPKRGDLIFFDWVSKSTGKNDGKADHVGLVADCKNGIITTIEGNAGNGVVKSRTFSINSANIYGFGTPNY